MLANLENTLYFFFYDSENKKKLTSASLIEFEFDNKLVFIYTHDRLCSKHSSLQAERRSTKQRSV